MKLTHWIALSALLATQLALASIGYLPRDYEVPAGGDKADCVIGLFNTIIRSTDRNQDIQLNSIREATISRWYYLRATSSQYGKLSGYMAVTFKKTSSSGIHCKLSKPGFYEDYIRNFLLVTEYDDGFFGYDLDGRVVSAEWGTLFER